MGALLIFLSAVADWVTGPQISTLFLYLVPICLVTWKGGRGMGLATAIVCGAVWLFVELETDTAYARSFIPYWNSLVRLAIFILVALLISEVVERRRAETALKKTRDELEHQRSILQSILDSMGEGVMVADGAGRLLLLNPAAEKMLGIDAREPRPATWQELQQRCLCSRLAAPPAGEHPLARAMRGEAVNSAEFFISHPDSPDGLWLLANGCPWLNARRNLERQIAAVSDREQQKLGQDLHDGLSQRLAGMSFAARVLADKLEERRLPEAEAAAKIAESLIESISQAKDIARGLYLVQLDSGGLAAALEELAAHAAASFGLDCRFIDRTAVPIGEGLAAVDLFRIAQEAVNNAARHARPKHVTIMLESDDEHISLSVEDDGCGLPENVDKPRGMGLHIMNYRARMIGASCEVKAAPAGGTVVACRLPHRNRKTELAHAQ
jgi:two-component system sensor kinase FixL